MNLKALDELISSKNNKLRGLYKGYDKAGVANDVFLRKSFADAIIKKTEDIDGLEELKHRLIEDNK